jgi:adenine specific DNA methylase Mod
MDYKLFLGREVVEYFSPEVQQWRPFVDQILLDEPIIIPVLTDTDEENSQASELQED